MSVIQYWGSSDRYVPKVHWPASLVGPGRVRDAASRRKVEITKEDIQSQHLACTHIHAPMNEHTLEGQGPHHIEGWNSFLFATSKFKFLIYHVFLFIKKLHTFFKIIQYMSLIVSLKFSYSNALNNFPIAFISHLRNILFFLLFENFLCAYSVLWSYLSPTPFPPIPSIISHQILYIPQNKIKEKQWAFLVLSSMHVLYDHLLEHGWLDWGHISEENCLSVL